MCEGHAGIFGDDDEDVGEVLEGVQVKCFDKEAIMKPVNAT